MKIIALAILLLMFVGRIKNTPEMISKTAFQKKLKSQTENLEKKNPDIVSAEATKFSSILALLIVEGLFIYGLFIYFYYKVSTYVNTDVFNILTSLQIFTCLYYTCTNISNITTYLNEKSDDIKFHRIANLFNLVLDYIYYPLAIYLLMK